MQPPSPMHRTHMVNIMTDQVTHSLNCRYTDNQARRKQVWMGGGGGQRPKGAHNFFSVGAHQWRSQLFGMGGAPNVATKKIKVLVSHFGRAKYLLS